MQDESEVQERLNQNMEASQPMLEQAKKDGEGDDVINNELQATANHVKASEPRALKPLPWKTDESRYTDLLEEAVRRGHPSTSQAASQAPPRLLVGDGKWQSTMVTLTVEGAAEGAARHYFNSDLWRYGGLVSLQQTPIWHEADTIDLRLSHEQIEVGLQEAQTRRSITWSWSVDETGVFRVQPEHVHVVEMVCGYLNLAAGAKVSQPVRASFGLPHSSECLYVGGMGRGGGKSFVEALTRAHGEPLMVPIDSSKESDRGNCLATESSEPFLTEGTVVQLPSAWSACEGNPCVCGNSVMVLDTTQEPLRVRELESGEDYLAISYVWAQHDQYSLLWHIERATEVTGVSLVWVDRLCINQRCGQHKARQIPLMREVYQKGYATVALVPDVTEILPTIFHSPTETVSRRNFGVRSRFKDQMRSCTWRTRCWTYQEGLLGRRGYYVTQKQVLPARIVSDAIVDLRVDKRQLGIGTELMDSLEVRSIRCQIQTWCQKLAFGDLLDAEDHELMEFWLMRQTKSLGEALRLTQARTASRPEDEIYSVLGMVPGGKDFQVVYGESRNAILRRAVNAGLLGVEILCSDRVSNRGGESWAAEDDTSWHIHHIYRVGKGMPGSPVWMDREIRGSAQIDDKGLKARFRRLEGLTGEAYLDGSNQSFCMLKLTNGEEELRFSMNLWKQEDRTRILVSRSMLQVLLLEELVPGWNIHAVLVSGTGRNVVRVATGDVTIPFWMKLETKLVWRVVG